MRPLLDELSRRGTPYVGVVYAGLMLGGDGSWQVLEFNARFGDPECQVLMSLLDLDLPEQLLAAAEGRLESAPPLSWAGDAAVCLVLASAGYPGPPAVGVPIEGLHQLPSGVLCFHGGTRYAPHLGLVTSGGRVLSLVARGATVAEARDAVYTAAGRVRFEGARFRRDIGEREVERSHA
jgi:phosphoribosylamine--glycine ligase